MAVAILYFASIREAMGISEEVVDIPSHIETLGELVKWLSTQSPLHQAAFADRQRLRAAIDQEMAGMNAPIMGAQEIAFFPPVTGG